LFRRPFFILSIFGPVPLPCAESLTADVDRARARARSVSPGRLGSTATTRARSSAKTRATAASLYPRDPHFISPLFSYKIERGGLFRAHACSFPSPSRSPFHRAPARVISVPRAGSAPIATRRVPPSAPRPATTVPRCASALAFALLLLLGSPLSSQRPRLPPGQGHVLSVSHGQLRRLL
jgi:hypothetical protein